MLRRDDGTILSLNCDLMILLRLRLRFRGVVGCAGHIPTRTRRQLERKGKERMSPRVTAHCEAHHRADRAIDNERHSELVIKRDEEGREGEEEKES